MREKLIAVVTVNTIYVNVMGIVDVGIAANATKKLIHRSDKLWPISK